MRRFVLTDEKTNAAIEPRTASPAGWQAFRLAEAG
jgi:hypothetical protein